MSKSLPRLSHPYRRSFDKRPKPDTIQIAVNCTPRKGTPVTRHTLPACEIEFHEGQQTMWVHSPDGTTTLRLKCTGKIIVDKSCVSPVAHADIIVSGDIHICVPAPAPAPEQALKKETQE